MFIRTIKQLLSLKNKSTKAERINSYLSAVKPLSEGDPRSSIVSLRAHLKKYPTDIDAINDLGCCLDSIGDQVSAGKCFKEALLINDTHPPLLVNHAKYLSEHKEIKKSLEILEKLKTYDPDSPNLFSVLGSIAHRIGDGERVSNYELQAWLGSFDSLRLANCYLFHLAYNSTDEEKVAAEHAFWAETLPPPPLEKIPSHFNNQKIRIGYWSPDFRNHSVRYFSRPLIENHNRDAFEIYIYYDFPHEDEHTAAIRNAADKFINVSELPDNNLRKIFIEDQLDILVEVAGHSSANRIDMLRERFARLQISALAYPPTTGLRTIDYKLLDEHITKDQLKKCYTENPLVLSNSFWCFDPIDKIPEPSEPPHLKNGFITFGCIGNITKITNEILVSWSKILKKITNSKLIIRSISFEDSTAIDFFKLKLALMGMPLNQVSILGPTQSKELFESYNEIDIILDTYPFNGGTTTCFCTYMGVPAVTIAGESLISRMGLSILSNLGLGELITKSIDEYTERAISLANDSKKISHIRKDLRSRFKKSSLGNGKLFASEFEEACIRALDTAPTPPAERCSPISENEVIRRAHVTLRHGNFNAADRIIEYCLRHYPNSGRAHLISTYTMSQKGDFSGAAKYLEEKMSKFSQKDQFIALINIIKFKILDNNNSAAELLLNQLTELEESDRQLLNQRDLLIGYLRKTPPQNIKETKNSEIKTIAILVITDNKKIFEEKKNEIQSKTEIPSQVKLEIIQTPKGLRHKKILKNIQNEKTATIIIHETISLINRYFFFNIIKQLKTNDIISFGGARKWERIDWQRSEATNKMSCVIIPSGEKSGFYEINITGNNRIMTQTNQSVLNGNFLAIKGNKLYESHQTELFEPALGNGGPIMEEYFSYKAKTILEMKLAVSADTGVIFNWQTQNDFEFVSEARWLLVELMNFKPLDDYDDDNSSISIPIPSVEDALNTIGYYFRNGSILSATPTEN